MTMTPRWLLLGASLVLAGSCVEGFGAERRLTTAVPRFTHPGAGQTFYFVLTDRFANGRADNDTGGIAGGPEQHGFDPTKISHFHGGDFAGLTARLDYLKNLGVTAVWVTPPFRNKPMQSGTAGYHGYWVLDFLNIDPHLGTNAEYREFIRQAHARGLKVYMDIIANHTADVIYFERGAVAYRDRASFPYRDAAGREFDDRTVAYNGLNDATAFPKLAADRSFAYVPVVPPAEAAAKHPAWLNDVTLYHNRGNSEFKGENSVLGDFAGLDDLFTEHPRVVQGFVAIFEKWIEDFGIDGYRIDTAKHVNPEFWQAFAPAIRAQARARGRPGFLQFGEVYNEAGDPVMLSEFSTIVPLDTTLDFGFFRAVGGDYVSRGGDAAALREFFANDDYYTDHDSNVHSTTTFLGNHDAGRFAFFLQRDNPQASSTELAALSRLGHGLLYLARGQPVLYYGDEQGMIGRGGNDMQAREDMFAAQAPDFRAAKLLATTRTGADDKFDTQHPFYRLFQALGSLRAGQPALRTGAMLPRTTGDRQVLAFSRLERTELVELLVVANNSRTQEIDAVVPTSQRPGSRLTCLFDSRSGTATVATVTVDDRGQVRVPIAPLQFSVWRAERSLAPQSAEVAVKFVAPIPGAALAYSTYDVDGQTFPTRQEIRAEVTGGDGIGEVTFTLVRKSRPHQAELIGVDDAPPYRVFWRPPADLAADEELTFVAVYRDLRGKQAKAEVAAVKVAPNGIAFGIRGAQVPTLRSALPPNASLAAGESLELTVDAGGTAPLEYQWLRDGEEIAGATQAKLKVSTSDQHWEGQYSVAVRNRAGTALSSVIIVERAAEKRTPRGPSN